MQEQATVKFVTVSSVEFNLARVIAEVAKTHPERVALMHQGAETSFPKFVDRYQRLGNAFAEAGLGCHTERSSLEGHESGQDHVALYLNNGPEYLEAMLGGWAARAATFNVNHRYVAEELRYLLSDSAAKAVVVNSMYAPTLAEVLADFGKPQPQVVEKHQQDSRPWVRRYVTIVGEKNNAVIES